MKSKSQRLLPAQKPKSKEDKRAQKKAAAAYGATNETAPVSKHPAFTKDDNWIFEEWESPTILCPTEKAKVEPEIQSFMQALPANLKQDINEEPEPYDIEEIEPRNLRANEQAGKSILAQNAQALIAATKSQTFPKTLQSNAASDLPYSHIPPHARH